MKARGLADLIHLPHINGQDIEAIYPLSQYQRTILFAKSQQLHTNVVCYRLSLPPDIYLTCLKNAWNHATEVVTTLRTGFDLSTDHGLALVYKPNVGRHAKWFESAEDSVYSGNTSTPDIASGEVPIAIEVEGSSPDGYILRFGIHRALCDHASVKLLMQFLHQVYFEQHTSPITVEFSDIIPAVESFFTNTASCTERPGSVWPHIRPDGTASLTWSFSRFSPTNFLGHTHCQALRMALVATMMLHSGTGSHHFIETVSCRSSLAPELQPVIGPYMLPSHTATGSAVSFLRLANKEEVLKYASAIHLAIHSPLDREDADIPGWNLTEGATMSSSPIRIDVLPSQAGSTEVHIQYHPSSLKEPVDIVAFAEHFISAFEMLSSVSHPTSIADIFRAISEAQREKILSFGTSGPNPDLDDWSRLLAHERVDAIATTSPSAIALDFESSSFMTYSELSSRSTALASELKAKGIRPEEMVPILFNVSFDMIIAILAVMKAGAAYVPLAPDHPRARWERILESISAKFLICGKDLASQTDVFAVQSAFPALTVLPYSHQSFISSSTSNSPAPSTIEESGFVYVFFTSGSTGTPKGVAVEHRNLRAFLNSGKGNVMSTPGMRRLLFSSYAFDVSVDDIFSTLTSGGTLGLVRREALLSDLPYWLDRMKPTHVAVTPSVGRYIPSEGLSHLRYVLFSGETLPVELAFRLSKTREVHNIMGPTEATIYCTEYTVPRLRPDGGSFGDRVPIGRPIDQNKTYILRPGTTELAVQGEVGEICIGGPQVARGYIGDGELSKAKFLPNPFDSSGTMFRTADLGRWNHLGLLDHLGRIDGQVKLRGLRIETGEIEYVVQKANPDLNAVHTDVIHVGDEQILAGVFMLKSLPVGVTDGDWTISSAIEEVARAVNLANSACDIHLPLYMKPTTWLCVTDLPMTTSGKTDRSALREKISAHITQMSGAPNGAIYHPRTPNEELVANIVANVLKLPVDNVDLNASLLALGGNSLQAMSLTAQLRDRGFDVNILRVLDYRVTLAELATSPIINGMQANGKSERTIYKPFALAPTGWKEAAKRLDINVQDIEDVHPVDVTARDWVRLALEHGGRGFGDLDAERFVWSWEQLRLREPILRTVFLDVDLNPEQKLRLDQALPFANSLGLTAAVLRPDIQGRGPFLDTSTAANAEEANALINKMFGDWNWDRTWLFASSRHHALHDFRSLGMQTEELSQLYHEGKAAFSKIERKRSVEGSFGAFMQAAHAPERQSSGRAFWDEYLADTTLPMWPPISEVSLSFYKDFATYGVHVVPWVGSLAPIAKKLGVTKGALARAAYAVAIAEKEKRDRTAIYEIVNGLSGLQLDPWGFCTHYQYTKVDTHPPGSEKSELERYIRVAQDCHQSYIKTLPYQASGCDMAAELLGAKSEPGQHFASALLNIFDLTEPQTPAQPSGNGSGSFSLHQRFTTTEQSSFVGVNLPLNVVVRIMDHVTVLICPYDLSIINKAEMEAFVQKHIDVLETLKEILV
ncbi:hypothetical protein VNI00_007754 [Paramarasmius palmivorus]|uniref:Carrier domain-containing protein n=1 Tax=Paramarasmius palmivorus TaxID=297713 RepID=A0AAW0D094_9AGAR